MKLTKLFITLTIVMILVLVSFKGNTQTLSDSTKIPDVQLNRVLRAAKAGKEYERLNRNYKSQLQNKDNEIGILNKKIYIRDTTIDYLKESVQLNKESFNRLQGNYNIEKAQHLDTKTEFNNFKIQANNEIKSLKRKKNSNKVVYGIGGTVVGTALGILIKSLIIK